MMEKCSNVQVKQKTELIRLVIRMNDITKILNDFEKFQDKSVKLCGKELIDRVENVFDDKFREMVASAN